MRAPRAHRTMTLDECKMARALAEAMLPRYKTGPSGEVVSARHRNVPSAAKLFAREMAIEARSSAPCITERQAIVLREMVQRFRGSLPATVLCLASDSEAIQ
jgi:hypothetical protein